MAEYEELLQRHQALLAEEKRLAARLKEATGAELRVLERKMQCLAAEGDAIFDVMLALLEKKHLEAVATAAKSLG
jgi:hypothetical protein